MLFGAIWLALMAFAVVSIVLWILSLVEVLRYPEPVWRYAGTDKTMWILVIVLAGGIGALIYWFSQRKRLKAIEADLGARGLLYAPPPQPYGYYPQQLGPQAPHQPQPGDQTQPGFPSQGPIP